MPIPFILGGIAVAAGLVGAKKALDANDKNARAKRINRRAEETFENAKKELLAARDEAGEALENLGRAKVEILHGSVTRFVDTFGKIHHVELTGSAGMDELSEFTVNEDALKEMGELGSLAARMASGTVEGLAAGGLMAFGAYSAAGLLGTAGTEQPLQAFRGGGHQCHIGPLRRRHPGGRRPWHCRRHRRAGRPGGGPCHCGDGFHDGFQGRQKSGRGQKQPGQSQRGGGADETGRRCLPGHRKTGGYVQKSDFRNRPHFQAAH